MENFQKLSIEDRYKLIWVSKAYANQFREHFGTQMGISYLDAHNKDILHPDFFNYFFKGFSSQDEKIREQNFKWFKDTFFYFYNYHFDEKILKDIFEFNTKIINEKPTKVELNNNDDNSDVEIDNMDIFGGDDGW